MAEERALPSAVAEAPDEIVIWHDPDGTIASVRNEIGNRAKGEWLCFLDADDELAPGFLDAMRRAQGQEWGPSPPTALLLTPAVSYVRNGRPAPPLFLDRGVPLTDDNWLIVGTLVQKDLFTQVGGFSDYPHGFEDYSLWAKCWRAGAKIVKVPDAVYVAHVNPRSKHRQMWRNRKWQREMHERFRRELFPELYA